MKKTMKTPLAAAMGVALLSTLSATAQAETFGANELPQGYMQLAAADKASEMACGANMNMDKAKAPEGACAGKKTEAKSADGKAAEASCGGMMENGKMKAGMEHSCGAMMKGKDGACGTMPAGEKAKEGACGAGMKMPEGKCGDQCGDNMKQCTDAKTKEGACGAQMKGCGEGMQGCGEMMKGKEGSCAAASTKAQSSSDNKGQEGGCASHKKIPELQPPVEETKPAQ